MLKNNIAWLIYWLIDLFIYLFIEVYHAAVCRHRSADTEERENPRPVLLGDGPTPGHQFPAEYDDGDDDVEYFYDDTEQHTYDNDDNGAGADAGNDNFTDGNTAQAAADIGQNLRILSLRVLVAMLNSFYGFVKVHDSKNPGFKKAKLDVFLDFEFCLVFIVPGP